MEKSRGLESVLLELNRDARAALAEGDVGGALEKLRSAIALEPESISLRLNYAAALRRSGDVEAALGATNDALRLDARNFNALLLKGVLLEAKGEVSEAGRAYGIALLFKPQQALDAPTASAVLQAEKRHAEYQAQLAEAVDRAVHEAFASEAKGPPANVERFAGLVTGRRRLYRPEPMTHHFPGLPSHEFYDRALFPWLGDIESKTADILKELRAAERTHSRFFVPYVNEDESLPLDQWRELNRSKQWSALHIIQHGATAPYASEALPETLQALQLIPQPDVPGRTPNAMFSVLNPHTRIPAHTGVSNARLVLHLPLIVPEGCGFRVGGETRAWKVGEAWVFDDTIEHEAWNDSDEMRVILIADLWNVFMTTEERKAYVSVVAALDAHHGGGGLSEL